jgi:phage terminase large subunit GpA-like protein
MKGAQVGGTEMACNWLGYVIDQAAAPFLFVEPTVELAKRLSRQRIDPMIQESPALRARVRPSRSRDAGNTVLLKEFPGGVVAFTGANSAVGLRMMPIPYACADEIDAYPDDVDNEGDPIALLEARQRTFPRRKLFLLSTPTVAGMSRIEREYEATDQRHYYVPCPLCGVMQVLEFERLRWEPGRFDAVRYVCAACGEAFGEEYKTRMLAAGEWRATTAASDPTVRGYHLPTLYSPLGWFSWADIARAAEDAARDPRKQKTFDNTILARTYAERGDAPDWRRLRERQTAEPVGLVPAGALFLTAGVDVQRDRLEVSVYGWGRGKRSWLVDHLVLDGEQLDWVKRLASTRTW